MWHSMNGMNADVEARSTLLCKDGLRDWEEAYVKI